MIGMICFNISESLNVQLVLSNFIDNKSVTEILTFFFIIQQSHAIMCYHVLPVENWKNDLLLGLVNRYYYSEKIK